MNHPFNARPNDAAFYSRGVMLFGFTVLVLLGSACTSYLVLRSIYNFMAE